MKSEEAAKLLNERLPSSRALEVMDSLDLENYEVYGVEGFLCHPNGDQEASLDLIFDLSSVFMNLSSKEKALFIRTFVANRARPNVLFEVYGGRLPTT